jgi:hypothetical protein
MDTQISLETHVALLSGRRYGPNDQHISPASLSTRQRLRNILDTLAALCISEPQDEAFAVSASILATGVTLYVSQTGVKPLEVIDHLKEVGKQLVGLAPVVRSHDRSALKWELDTPLCYLAGTIYQHSLPVFRKLFMDMAEGFIATYESAIEAGREFGDEYARLFTAVSCMHNILDDSSPSDYSDICRVALLAEWMRGEWRKELDETNDKSFLSGWHLEKS